MIEENNGVICKNEIKICGFFYKGKEFFLIYFFVFGLFDKIEFNIFLFLKISCLLLFLLIGCIGICKYYFNCFLEVINLLENK